MKKIVAFFCIIIIFLSIMCGLLFYEIGDVTSQNSNLQNKVAQLERQVSELELDNIELQNQIDELDAYIQKISSASLVQITEFNLTGSPVLAPAGGWTSDAIVTVKNFGTSAIDGLKLVVNSTGDMTPQERQIDLLDAGEDRTVTIDVFWGMFDYEDVFVATLMLDNVILDVHATGAP